MGYTHYWGDHDSGHTFSDEEWSNLKKVAKSVIKIAVKQGIALQYEYDQERGPQVDDEVIRFNGKDEDGHETFLLRKSGGWEFCKTAYKPYDTAVVAILLAAQSFGLRVSSDGSDQEDGSMNAADKYFREGAKLLHEALEEMAVEH